MNNQNIEILHRAVINLQTFCTLDAQDRGKQRIDDLKREIVEREQNLLQLEVQREDLVCAAELSRTDDSALALAFENRAGILSDEIERQRPYGLQKKLREAEKHLREMQLIAQILDSSSFRVLNG